MSPLLEETKRALSQARDHSSAVLAFVSLFERNRFSLPDPYPILVLDCFSQEGKGFLDLYVEFHVYESLDPELSQARTIDNDGEKAYQLHLFLCVGEPLLPRRLAEWDHLSPSYRAGEKRQKEAFLNQLAPFLKEGKIRSLRLEFTDSI